MWQSFLNFMGFMIMLAIGIGFAVLLEKFIGAIYDSGEIGQKIVKGAGAITTYYVVKDIAKRFVDKKD